MRNASREVAVPRRQRGRREIALEERGEDADGDRAGALRGRGPLDLREGRIQFRREHGEGAAGEGLRRRVDLQIEAIDFEREAGIPGLLQHGLVDQRRTCVLVDEVELELGADRLRSDSESFARQQLLQGGERSPQPAGEPCMVFLEEVRVRDLGSHGAGC
jgi:hypothetical protein